MFLLLKGTISYKDYKIYVFHTYIFNETTFKFLGILKTKIR